MTPSKSLAKNKSLITLGIAESVSNTGNWITMLAIFALVVFRGQGGVVESSGIFLAGLLPLLLASPLAGWLCDRYDRKTLMIASELLSGAAVAGLIFVQQLEHYYALLALQAVFTSLMLPARQAAIPSIVAREDLPRANAFLQQIAGIIKIGAPILAGVVLAVMDPHQAIVLDLISFLLSAAILTRLPALKPPQRGERVDDSAAPSGSGDRRQVFTMLKNTPGLRMLFLVIFFTIFIIVGFDVLASVYIRDVLHSDEKMFGVFIGFIGAGTILSTGYIMLNKRNSRPWRDLSIGLLGMSCIPLTFGLGTFFKDMTLITFLAFAGCLIGGMGNGLILTQSGTLLQLMTLPEALGRMSGAYQAFAIAGQMAGIILTPILIPGIMDMRSFFLCSLAGLLVLACVLIQFVRRLPQTPLQPAPYEPAAADSTSISRAR